MNRKKKKKKKKAFVRCAYSVTKSGLLTGIKRMSAETLPRQMPRVDSSGGNMAEIEWEEIFCFVFVCSIHCFDSSQ